MALQCISMQCILLQFVANVFYCLPLIIHAQGNCQRCEVKKGDLDQMQCFTRWSTEMVQGIVAHAQRTGEYPGHQHVRSRPFMNAAGSITNQEALTEAERITGIIMMKNELWSLPLFDPYQQVQTLDEKHLQSNAMLCMALQFFATMNCALHRNANADS